MNLGRGQSVGAEVLEATCSVFLGPGGSPVVVTAVSLDALGPVGSPLPCPGPHTQPPGALLNTDAKANTDALPLTSGTYGSSVPVSSSV